MLTNSRNKLNIMLFRPLTRIIAICLAIGLGCASANAAVETPEQLYQIGKKALKAEDFQSAIDEFYTLQRTFPATPFAQRAVLDLAYAYYRLGDYAQARSEAERFISANPDHPQLPFAYYVAGLTHYTSALKLLSPTNTDPVRANAAGQQALSYFGLLTEQFPQSEYSAHAKLRSAYLLEKLAASQHDMGTIAPVAPMTADFGDGKEIKKEAWILKQLPTNYTLQLLTSPNLIEILQMVDEHGLTGQSIIYEIQHHNGIVYTLLYGMFGSEKIAMDVGSRLPREILDIQPSIKQLAEVQALILENRKPVTTPVTVAAKETKPEPVAPITAERKPAAAGKAVPKSRAIPTKQSGQQVNQWIMAQPPLYYTIQLAGMGRERSVQRFIREHPSDKEINYYHGLRKDKEWYGVIHGAYPNLKQAKSAAAELEKELGIDPPWIRRVRAIQKSIRRLKELKR